MWQDGGMAGWWDGRVAGFQDGGWEKSDHCSFSSFLSSRAFLKLLQPAQHNFIGIFFFPLQSSSIPQASRTNEWQMHWVEDGGEDGLGDRGERAWPGAAFLLESFPFPRGILWKVRVSG